MFPIRSVEGCLALAGLKVTDVDTIVIGWDAPLYTNGGMETFYRKLNERYTPDANTLSWQRRNLTWFSESAICKRVQDALVRHFGISPKEVPPVTYYPHHLSHAAASFYLSSFEEGLVLTLDGSGDRECTAVWHGRGTTLTPVHTIEIPHSLGWFYAAMTEYLGFRAYDGEYKVMGLAAYGRENLQFRELLSKFVHPGDNRFDYVVEPRYVHHGKHTYSTRFTDELVQLLPIPPRLGPVALEKVHEDLAYETQWALEHHVLRLLSYFREQTGIRNLCIAGGVGLNVKMNSRIRKSGLFDRMFAFPIPNDSGTAIGAAIGHWVTQTETRPAPLQHVYLGLQYTDKEIEAQMEACGLSYRKCEDIADATADLLAQGRVVGWFQGRLEGGPRALGGRSILADPRSVQSRDRVNAAIKFREYWRPFCPSMTEEAARKYLRDPVPSPFMVVAFDATEEAKQCIPAVVHVDNTVRVQTVAAQTHPVYHRLLTAFEAKTGVPVVLNTSFNVKGEAIVCTPRDAFRTFWSTGIDALAIGSFLIEKPIAPQVSSI